jgi:hypothetical protein
VTNILGFGFMALFPPPSWERDRSMPCTKCSCGCSFEPSVLFIEAMSGPCQLGKSPGCKSPRIQAQLRRWVCKNHKQRSGGTTHHPDEYLHQKLSGIVSCTAIPKEPAKRRLLFQEWAAIRNENIPLEHGRVPDTAGVGVRNPPAPLTGRALRFPSLLRAQGAGTRNQSSQSLKRDPAHRVLNGCQMNRVLTLLARATPKSSAFTISATTPYTTTVIPNPTSASTRACVTKLPAGTAASVIVMISAERMQPVLMALATFSSLHRHRIQRDSAELRFMLMCTMWHDGFEHFEGSRPCPLERR